MSVQPWFVELVSPNPRLTKYSPHPRRWECARPEVADRSGCSYLCSDVRDAQEQVVTVIEQVTCSVTYARVVAVHSQGSPVGTQGSCCPGDWCPTLWRSPCRQCRHDVSGYWWWQRTPPPRGWEYWSAARGAECQGRSASPEEKAPAAFVHQRSRGRSTLWRKEKGHVVERERRWKAKCDREWERKLTVFHQECLTGWEEGQGHVCGGEDQIPPGEQEKELQVQPKIAFLLATR